MKSTESLANPLRKMSPADTAVKAGESMVTYGGEWKETVFKGFGRLVRHRYRELVRIPRRKD